MTMMTVITITISKHAIAEVETGRGSAVPPAAVGLDKRGHCGAMAWLALASIFRVRTCQRATGPSIISSRRGKQPRMGHAKAAKSD
jgi:hypothetical protein